MDELVTTVLPDKRLIWLLTRYQVTMTCEARSYGTQRGEMSHLAKVIIESDARRLTIGAWSREGAETALDEALAKAVRQVEALDALM